MDSLPVEYPTGRKELMKPTAKIEGMWVGNPGGVPFLHKEGPLEESLGNDILDEKGERGRGWTSRFM